MYEVQPQFIARELNISNNEGMKAVLHALEIMSLGSVAMLEMRYEWHDDSPDVLAMPILLDGEVISAALRSGFMESPTSGERLTDFSERIHIAFMIRMPKALKQASVG